MSKSVNQNRQRQKAERRNASAKKRAARRDSHRSSHNSVQETPTWESVKQIYDDVIELTSGINHALPYLDDPEIQKRLNYREVDESIKSIQLDTERYIHPEMTQLYDYLKDKSGPVAEDDTPHFVEQYMRLSQLAVNVANVIEPQIKALFITINDAVIWTTAELGLDEPYLPVKVQEALAVINSDKLKQSVEVV